jgi:hypothetical protein
LFWAAFPAIHFKSSGAAFLAPSGLFVAIRAAKFPQLYPGLSCRMSILIPGKLADRLGILFHILVATFSPFWAAAQNPT